MSEEPQEEDFKDEILPPISKPRIFEGNWQLGVPGIFDAVTIYLDGGMRADLDWKKQREEAQRALDCGYAVMWHMHLGFHPNATFSLTHQAQFLALSLSLEHFRDTLWQEFKKQTVGLSLFRGSADFSQGFVWDAQQEENLIEWRKKKEQSNGRHFCRNVVIEYLLLLTNRLPDSLSLYLFLDAGSLVCSPFEELQLLNPEAFGRMQLALRNHHLPFNVLGWGGPTEEGYSGDYPAEVSLSHPASVGFCVPSGDLYSSSHELEKGLITLIDHKISFKFIAESHMTSQWDGLDYLVFSPSVLTMQGKRKLQGFCSAGGAAVSTGSLVGLPLEINLADLISEYIPKK